MTQSLRILDGNRLDRTEDAHVPTLRLRLARLNGDQVGAELAEFGQHELMQPFADGSEKDHCRNADGDAQAGQKTA